MNPDKDLGGDGRIPFPLRIGVVGHRHLEAEEALEALVKEALGRIRGFVMASRQTPVRFTVVSSLAEGADRLVVREALKGEAATLEAVLPFPQEEYVKDFRSPESQGEFAALLSRAANVLVVGPSETREEAYERGGRYVVDRSDVLIALWDGEPSRGRGGTADVVHYAQERGRPLLWIVTKKPRYAVRELPGTGFRPASLKRVDEYDRARISKKLFADQVTQYRHKMISIGRQEGLEALSLEVLSRWISPFYVRADTLAQSYRQRYYALNNAQFLLAAAAVAAIAAQALLLPERHEGAWLEVGLIGVVLVIVAAGRSARLQDRWVAYRFLAERFRSAFFLALTGLRVRHMSRSKPAFLGRPSEEWLQRAFSEVWTQRPTAQLTEANIGGLREFLAEAWIEDQRLFYERTGRQNRSRYLRLGFAIVLLLLATLLAGALHSLGLGEDQFIGPLEWSPLFTLFSISLPALGAALAGIRAQREYLRNSERFSQLEHHLSDIKHQMRNAPDLKAIRAVAMQAEQIMLEENQDWFVVMSFHDFELHM